MTAIYKEESPGIKYTTLMFVSRLGRVVKGFDRQAE